MRAIDADLSIAVQRTAVMGAALGGLRKPIDVGF